MCACTKCSDLERATDNIPFHATHRGAMVNNTATNHHVTGPMCGSHPEQLELPGNMHVDNTETQKNNNTNNNNNYYYHLDSPSFPPLSPSSTAAGTKRAYPEYESGPRKTVVKSSMESDVGPQGSGEAMEERRSSHDEIPAENPQASQAEADAEKNEEEGNGVSLSASPSETQQGKWSRISCMYSFSLRRSLVVSPTGISKLYFEQQRDFEIVLPSCGIMSIPATLYWNVSLVVLYEVSYSICVSVHPNNAIYSAHPSTTTQPSQAIHPGQADEKTSALPSEASLRSIYFILLSNKQPRPRYPTQQAHQRVDHDIQPHRLPTRHERRAIPIILSSRRSTSSSKTGDPNRERYRRSGLYLSRGYDVLGAPAATARKRDTPGKRRLGFFSAKFYRGAVFVAAGCGA